MMTTSRPISHRARTDTKFLIDATSSQPPRARETDQISYSYPGTSSMSTPTMGTPPSPTLQPERPPRSASPEPWNLSSPNPSEMPSPLRKALAPMLNLAREAKEETYADHHPREARPVAPPLASDERDVPLSRRSSSKVRSLPASPPASRPPPAQGSRKYHSPRVETDSEPEEGISSRSWRTPVVERVERVEPEEPRTPPIPLIGMPTGVRMSPRRSTKNKVKRASTSMSVAQRRLMDMAAMSSDSGIAPSPLCHSPLVALPLPDIPQSASDVERLFFPPERPIRSHQRPSPSPVPSPSQSPLALQPVSISSRPASPQSGREREGKEEEEFRASSPAPSRGSSRGRGSPASMSVPIPLSPGSTLAQTRPVSPSSDPRASPKVPAREHARSSKRFVRTPSPVEEPAVRHLSFYMEDEMVILRVENCLFRIHRYFLERDSTYFKEFFRRELVFGAGKTDATAIRLPDVSQREFECLLHFLYYGANSPLYDSALNLVLLLSTSYQLSFPAARAHAISALDAASPPLDPVERLFLAEKYNIPTWLRPAYVELCSRSHPLEDSEAEVLGLQTTARLARAREAVLEEKVQEWKRAVGRAESGQGVTKEDMEVREAKLVEKVVDDIFGSER